MLCKSLLPTGVILSLMFFLCPTYAQVQVNLDWQASTGSPAEAIDYSVSTIDNAGNLIVVGNTLTSTEAENFLISKFDGEGSLLWEAQYDFGDSSDYATGVVTDNSDNIYVTGASFNSTSDFDYATVKLNSSGAQQWSVLYDGTGSGEDVPVDIKIDYLGNLYVTGVSTGSSTGKDFATVKYNSSGTQQWATRYDYAGLKDGAVGLILDDSTQRVTVTGASARSATAWDFATVSYDYTNGNQQSLARQSTGATGYSSPIAIVNDDAGNTYITGSAITTSGTQDIQTLKLDTTLNVVWTATYYGGQVDGGSDLKVDENGNVFVVGYTDQNEGLDFFTIKYDENGSELWTISHSADQSTDSAVARFITLGEEGEFMVTGDVRPDGGGDTYIITLLYSTDGELLSESTYTDPNAEGIPTDLRADLFGSVYLTGKLQDDSTTNYITLKYSVFQSRNDLKYDGNGKATHVADQLIVRFDENVVSSAWVDNTDLNFGLVKNIIADTALISTMSNKIGNGRDVGYWTMSRIYKDWPTTRTTAISRLGRTITLPKLWSTFILYVPEPIPESTVDEFTLCDSLNTIPANKLRYSHPNVIAQLTNTPNDPSYTNNRQASLWYDPSNPAVFTDADINVSPAWNLLHNASPREPKGKNSVKVGVYDTGIHHTHEDIRGAGNHGGLSGSIVDQGFDYLQSGTAIPIQANAATPDNDGHGTAVTGIIGALRNNNTGVSGIAGGDISVDSDAGVHFVSMRMARSTAQGGVQIGHAIAAIGDAVLLNSNNRPLFDIMNNSWGADSSLNIIALDALRDVVKMAYTAEIILVNGRGNAGVSSDFYPATFPDDWGISVGASGEDGERFSTANTNDAFASNFGKAMDVLAPGINAMVFTTDEDNNTSYEEFNGTSAAAPHVAGLAALIQSYADDTLAPEDIEHIIEFGADDKALNANPQLLGFDDESGWGLIDAGASLQMIEKPYRKIRHYEGDSTHIFEDNTLGKNIILTQQYSFFRPGPYSVDVHQIRMKVALDLAPGEAVVNILPFFGRAQWVRNSGSNLWGAPPNLFSPTFDFLNPWEDVQILGGIIPGTDTIVLEGFYYEFPDPFGGTNRTVVPTGVDVNPIMAFSVLIHDSTLTNVDQELQAAESVYLFPNPAKDFSRVQYSLLEAMPVCIDLLDIQGRTLRSFVDKKEVTGIHCHILDLSNIKTGVYLCRFRFGDYVVYKKLIKG